MEETQYLAHFGIKGMRWGVRRYQNPDGTLTSAGKKRAAHDIDRKINRDPSGYAVHPFEQINTLQGDPAITKMHANLANARNKMSKAYRYHNEFYGNEELVNKYREKVARQHAKRNGATKKSEIDEYIYEYKYGDWDRGGKSYTTYLKDHGHDVDSVIRGEWAAHREYMDACKSAVTDMLGKYGDKKVKSIAGRGETIASITAKTLRELGEFEVRAPTYHSSATVDDRDLEK